MSVLSFPRIYFNGYVAWDPTTANNNDYLPVYDATNVDLDWVYLAEKGITRENFQDMFRPWMIRPQHDVCENSSPSDTCPQVVSDTTNCDLSMVDPNYHMGSRWDYFGGGGCWFADFTAPDPKYNKKTLTSGGDLAYSQPAQPGDAILNKPVVIEGNAFGDRPSMARLVDINPATPFCSQIFFSKIKVGDDQTYLSAPRQVRMYSRAFLAPRNISNKLIIAGAIGVIFQTTMSYASLQIANGGRSPLLAKLQQAMNPQTGARGAKGLMITFAAYNTLYYKNGKYNNIIEQPPDCCSLSKMLQEGKVFMNPAYSRMVGVLGVWNEGELSSVPGGHQLVPVRKLNPVNPPKSNELEIRAGEFVGLAGKASVMFSGDDLPKASAQGGPPPFPQGTTWAQVDVSQRLVSLNMMNTFVEFNLNDITNDGQKFDYGTLKVGVDTPGGFQEIGSFGYDQYNLAAYLKQSGLVDVPFASSANTEDVQNWLSQGGLALQAQQGGQWQTFCQERLLTADTDSRGVYIDQGQTAEFTVQVRYKYGAPPPNTYLQVAQYFPFPLTVGSGVLLLFPAPDSPWKPNTDVCQQTPDPKKPYVSFVNGAVVPVTAKPNQAWGEAVVRLASQHPGFPVIVFYPLQASNQPPTPPAAQPAITFGFPADAPEPYNGLLIGNAGYSAVRVLPFDTKPMDGKVSPLVDFVDRWNGTGPYAGQPKYNRELTWKWIYSNILYVYDMLFPVMDGVMPLHSLERVEGAIDQLVVVISADWVDTSTLYMPVTRDLSAAKRLILETWGDLVIRKYPQQPLPPLSLLG